MRRKGLLDKGIPHGGMKSPGCLESREQGGDSGGQGGQGPGLLGIVLWLRPGWDEPGWREGDSKGGQVGRQPFVGSPDIYSHTTYKASRETSANVLSSVFCLLCLLLLGVLEIDVGSLPLKQKCQV